MKCYDEIDKCLNCDEYSCDEINCTVREKLGYALKLAEIGLWEWDLKTNMVQFSCEAIKIIGLELSNSIVPISYIVDQVLYDDSYR